MSNGSAKEHVGIVGVGRMGLAMLKHLVRHGHAVTACDIDEAQLAKARDAGAATVKTPAEAARAALASEASDQRGHSKVRAPDTRPEPGSSARAAHFVIVGVGYDDEVNQVVLGPDGLLTALAPGSVIAVSSTAKPDTVKALDQRARAQGVDVLDAPICRGRFAADAGTLLALVGGRPEVVERGRTIYRAFCSDYAHLGEVGHGQVGKTMNNLLLWINAVGLMEAGRLAETTGIDLARLREALLMSSGASDALKEWDMISFTWALKDMQIVGDLTDKAGLSLPLTGAIKELVKDARRIKATNAPKWTGSR
jgi:3-hydroxyisobutyrate dehydrogenase